MYNIVGEESVVEADEVEGAKATLLNEVAEKGKLIELKPGKGAVYVHVDDGVVSTNSFDELGGPACSVVATRPAASVAAIAPVDISSAARPFEYSKFRGCPSFVSMKTLNQLSASS